MDSFISGWWEYTALVMMIFTSPYRLGEYHHDACSIFSYNPQCHPVLYNYFPCYLLPSGIKLGKQIMRLFLGYTCRISSLENYVIYFLKENEIVQRKAKSIIASGIITCFCIKYAKYLPTRPLKNIKISFFVLFLFSSYRLLFTKKVNFYSKCL